MFEIFFFLFEDAFHIFVESSENSAFSKHSSLHKQCTVHSERQLKFIDSNLFERFLHRNSHTRLPRQSRTGPIVFPLACHEFDAWK